MTARRLTVSLVINESRPSYRRTFADLLHEIAMTVKHDATNRTGKLSGVDDETGETWSAGWKIT